MTTELIKKEISKIQESWGNGLVEIGKIYSEKGYIEAKVKATRFINTNYDYDNKNEEATVLFKPTLVSKEPFRMTFEGALSYFVGGNPDYPEDKGFALTPYIHVSWKNKDTRIIGNMAIAMGHYYFYTTPDDFVIVEYSFVYLKNIDENKKPKIKIILQHSSLPYSPKEIIK